MRLPRGICPYCRLEVALRKGGLTREHRYQLGQRMSWCPGSGLPARSTSSNHA